MGDGPHTDYSRAAAELRNGIARLVAAVYPNTGGHAEVCLDPAEYAKALSELGRLERWLNGLHEAAAAMGTGAPELEPLPELPGLPPDDEPGTGDGEQGRGGEPLDVA